MRGKGPLMACFPKSAKVRFSGSLCIYLPSAGGIWPAPPSDCPQRSILNGRSGGGAGWHRLPPPAGGKDSARDGTGFRWSIKLLVAMLALTLTTAARDPILVPDVSQHEIEVRQGFTGTQLLLFGAILTPEGTRAGQDYDIVVVLEGPAAPIVLREKKRFAGVWLNANSTTFQSAPSYYAVASSRPITKIVGDQTAAIYELGLPWLQLSPTGTIDPAAQTRFAAGLVDLRKRHGLYREDEGSVTITGQVLYKATIFLPSSVPVGSYTAETFAVHHGRVVASAISRVQVRKQGFERAIDDFAHHSAFSYGLFTVVVSVLMGWLAGRLFALI